MGMPLPVLRAVIRDCIDRWIDHEISRMEKVYRARGIPERVIPKDESKVRKPRKGSTSWMRRKLK